MAAASLLLLSCSLALKWMELAVLLEYAPDTYESDQPFIYIRHKLKSSHVRIRKVESILTRERFFFGKVFFSYFRVERHL